MSTEQDLNFTTTDVPESWRQAAIDSPSDGGSSGLTRTSTIQTVPPRESLDLFTAVLTAAAIAIAIGYGWYELEVSGAATPWAPIALGVTLPIAIRLGGGSADHQTRAALSLLLYLTVVPVVVFVVAQDLFADLYGTSPGLLDIERLVLNSHLSGAWAVLAWVVGAMASIKVSYLFGRRHR